MQLLKKLHKWLSLLVGLQLLIWLGTGIYFNLMDHQKASGNQYRQQPAVAQVETHRLVEPQLVLAKSKQAVSLKQISLLAQPYYLLTHTKGLYSNFKNNYSLVNAYTGEPVAIDELMAADLAKSSYKGNGAVNNVIKLAPPYDDIPREQNEVWQVNFADEINTSVYVDVGSGRIIKHSNDDKRFVDIFFMLHFMDYGTEGSFNNVQIIIFALFTLFFALTGFIWTIELGFNGQYKISFKRKKRTLSVFDKDQQPIGDFDVATNANLLDGLVEHDIVLSSTCGGGGSCGQCKVQLNKQVKINSAEYEHFSEQELQQGYRLACQHNSTEIDKLTLITAADASTAKKHLLTLTHSEFISPFIKEVRFKVVGGEKVTFKAGAHMRFFIPAAKGVSIPQRLPDTLKPHWHHIDHLEFEHNACSRSYSIANAHDQNEAGTDELTFTIKIQNSPNKSVLPGVGSSYLCSLLPGQTIEAVGPLEDFYAKPLSKNTMVLIGAGSGMAPLKSLIEEQLMQAPTSNAKGEKLLPREIHFFYGARSEHDLLYQEQFLQLAKQYPQFNYYPVLSQPSSQWLGEKGYAQALFTSKFGELSQFESAEFYLCGPPKMMATILDFLKNKNVDATNIAFDEFTQ